MKVKVYYCKKCRTSNIRRCYKKKYCADCRTGSHISILHTDVELPKPHIERGTLIRVWDDHEGYKYVRNFEKFDTDGGVLCFDSTNDSDSLWYKHYEFINADEVNPNIRKGVFK